MDGQEPLHMAAPTKRKSIAEEKYSEKDFLVEQISVERGSPTSFVPEVITCVLQLVMTFNVILIANKLLIYCQKI